MPQPVSDAAALAVKDRVRFARPRSGLPWLAREPWRRWFVKIRGKEIPLADAGERELIAALHHKDMAALEQLFKLFGEPMATLARSMLRDPTEAQDVVEEALVRAHEAGPGFRGEHGVRTWVLRITANLCRDRLRRRRFTAASLDGPTPLDDPALRFEPVADWDEGLDQRVLATRLDAAIARLPANQREVVVLRHQLGLSYEDMCGTLGVPLGTIKSRLARALAALLMVSVFTGSELLSAGGASADNEPSVVSALLGDDGSYGLPIDPSGTSGAASSDSEGVAL